MKIPAGIELRMRSEEHTSELQSRETISYAVFCLNKKKKKFSSNSLRLDHLILLQQHKNNTFSTE